MEDDGALPAGVRFYPTEPELVGFYLRNKLEHRRPDMERFVPVVDVYSHEPMELPLMSGEASVRDPEQWFFFCPRQAREAQGGRPTRTTRSGYWKATGSPTPVFHHDGRVIGVRKSMVFYQGRAPAGRKTSWKMNEYRAAAAQQEDGRRRGQAPSSSSSAPAPGAAASRTTGNIADLKWRSEFSLCRVYKKSGHLRSFDRRPILRGKRENPAGAVDVDGGVHVVPSDVIPSTSSRPPPDHGKAAAGAMADDDGMVLVDDVGGGGSTSGGRQRHLTTTELGDDDDGDCDLEGLDWDSLIGFDRT